MRHICNYMAKVLNILDHGYKEIYSEYINYYSVYVNLDRALYGTIEATKVWYDTLSTNLVV